METYKLDAECYNCGAWYDDDHVDCPWCSKPALPSIVIEKGTRLCDVPCEVCGCRTLLRQKDV